MSKPKKWRGMILISCFHPSYVSECLSLRKGRVYTRTVVLCHIRRSRHIEDGRRLWVYVRFTDESIAQFKCVRRIQTNSDMPMSAVGELTRKRRCDLRLTHSVT